jgi:predicted  nucleic acid-binding Zn-ribbon protein
MNEQPMPKPGTKDVTPYARQRMVEMLAEREAKGIAAYGTTLQANNGRDALRDAMEECADLWQYLCQLEMEQRDLRSRYERLRECAEHHVGSEVLDSYDRLMLEDTAEIERLRVECEKWRNEYPRLRDKYSDLYRHARNVLNNLMRGYSTDAYARDSAVRELRAALGEEP